VFADSNDPDYQALKAMCVAGQQRLETIKRFDIAGFSPRKDWVREMKRYGVLASDLPAGPIDFYTVEQQYWRSLWYSPPTK
jgi:hypothetical protein